MVDKKACSAASGQVVWWAEPMDEEKGAAMAVVSV
jgi:hypothetical protein